MLKIPDFAQFPITFVEPLSPGHAVLQLHSSFAFLFFYSPHKQQRLSPQHTNCRCSPNFQAFFLFYDQLLKRQLVFSSTVKMDVTQTSVSSCRGADLARRLILGDA